MPTLTITLQVHVNVSDLKPETIGGVMCEASAATMEAVNAQFVSILDVKTYDREIQDILAGKLE
jgi:hypothetical protein